MYRPYFDRFALLLFFCRYHPLPEAKYELLPPADFLRKVKRQNSMGMNRRSRSMENFRNHTNPSSISTRQNSSKKYASGSLHQKIPRYVMYVEANHS